MSHISLSYSRLSTYEQCPAKFYSQYIAKDYPDDSQNFHFIKGKKKHTQCENYIKCKNDPTMIALMYDGDVQDVFPIIDNLFNSGFSVDPELQLAVGTDWKVIEWFSKRTMYRAIVDCLAMKEDKAKALDFKTGKFRDYDSKETGQLHLTSAVIFSLFPHINHIETAYLYLEHKQSVRRQFTREMYENGLLTPFNKSFQTVNEDVEFAPKRNQFCNWCLKKENGTCSLFSK